MYVLQAPTTTTDRACRACSANTFSAEANAASCNDHKTCPPGTRVQSSGTATQDRVCASCPAGTYTSANNVANCQAHKSCQAGERTTQPGTPTSDRVCGPCPANSFSAANNNQATCTPATACTPGTFVQNYDPLPTANRVCAVCPDSQYSLGFNEPTCLTCQLCSRNNFETTPCTRTTDRACSLCKPCGANQYIAVQCSGSSNTVCNSCRSCARGLTATGGCQGTQDTICTDTIPPTLSLVGQPTVYHEAGTRYDDQGATASDPGVPDRVLTSNITVTGSINVTRLTSQRLTYNVKDAAGNAAAPVMRTVVVRDTRPPVLQPNELAAKVLEVGDLLQRPTMSAQDTISGAVQVGDNATDPWPLRPPVGPLWILFSAADGSANKANVSWFVNVTDTTPPTIRLNGPSTLEHEAATTFVDPGFQVVDAGDPNPTVTTDGVPVDPYAPLASSFRRTYTARDRYGNTASPLLRFVTLQDTTAPVMTLLGQNTVVWEAGQPWTDDPGAQAVDAYDGEVAVEVSGTVNVMAPNGTVFVLTYSARDSSGNANNTIRKVVIRDTTPPAVVLQGPAAVQADLTTSWTDPAALAQDILDGDVEVQASYFVHRGAIPPAPPALYQLQCPAVASVVECPLRRHDGAPPSVQCQTADGAMLRCTANACATEPKPQVPAQPCEFIEPPEAASCVLPAFCQLTTEQQQRCMQYVHNAYSRVDEQGDHAYRYRAAACWHATAVPASVPAEAAAAELPASALSSVMPGDVLYIRYTARDATGNAGQAVRRVVAVDSVAPVFAAKHGSDVVKVPFGVPPPPLQFSAQDNVDGNMTGWAQPHVLLDADRVLMGCASPGQHTLTVRLPDSAGNVAALLRQVTVDAPPTVPVAHRVVLTLTEPDAFADHCALQQNLSAAALAHVVVVVVSSEPRRARRAAVADVVTLYALDWNNVTKLLPAIELRDRLLGAPAAQQVVTDSEPSSSLPIAAVAAGVGAVLVVLMIVLLLLLRRRRSSSTASITPMADDTAMYHNPLYDRRASSVANHVPNLLYEGLGTDPAQAAYDATGKPASQVYFEVTRDRSQPETTTYASLQLQPSHDSAAGPADPAISPAISASTSVSYATLDHGARRQSSNTRGASVPTYTNIIPQPYVNLPPPPSAGVYATVPADLPAQPEPAQPRTLLQEARAACPFFHEHLTRTLAENLLAGRPAGNFLLRERKQAPSQLVLSVCVAGRGVGHIIIERTASGELLCNDCATHMTGPLDELLAVLATPNCSYIPNCVLTTGLGPSSQA